MPHTQLTKQILEYTESTKNMKWIAKVAKDLQGDWCNRLRRTRQRNVETLVHKWKVIREVKELKTKERKGESAQ